MMGGKNADGYTILEVMIFLVVTSFIFVSAMVTVSGQQEKTQFSQAVRELDQSIQGVINDVTNGFFPSTDVRCDTNNTAAAPIAAVSFPSGSTEQGKNQNCIFVGKALHFAVSDSPNTSGSGIDFNIYSMAGRRQVGPPAQPRQTVSLDQSFARVVPGKTDYSSTRFGLKVMRVVNAAGPAQEVQAIAIVSSFGTYAAGSSSLNTESRSSRLAILSGSSTGQPEATVVGTIDSSAPANRLSEASVTNAANSGGILVCLENTTGTLRAVIIVGEQGRSLSTRIDQDVAAGEFPRCGAGF